MHKCRLINSDPADNNSHPPCILKIQILAMTYIRYVKMIAAAPHQAQIYRVLPGLVERDCVRIICFGGVSSQVPWA